MPNDARTSIFDLHPRLRQDCHELGRFELCRLLLMNESRYPWFVLVPERADVSEIYQLPEPEQIQLILESSRLARTLASAFDAEKMNVAAIGNLVPQLHIHHVVRYRNDAAWPAPVWGRFDPLPYDEAALTSVRWKLRGVLSPDFIWSSP